MDDNTKKQTCLEPYRVLDLTGDGCQLCGKILGDLGADVIKVEPPGGDPSRRIGPFYHDVPGPENSLFWYAYNANKRSITLDLAKAEGRETLLKLAAKADFIIESFAPRYLDGLGLGYDDFSGVNPRIIVVSITPFGQDGPYAGYKASDLTTWAMSGYLYLCGDSDRAPTWISFPQAYLQAASDAAAAAMIAHWRREATQEGQHVDVSIQESASNFLFDAQIYWDIAKYNMRRTGNTRMAGEAVVPIGCRCKDGYINITTMGGGGRATVAGNKALVAWMDEEGSAPQWMKDLDWAISYDTMHLSQALVDKVTGAVGTFLANKTKLEVLEQAVKRGIIAAPVCSAKDISDSAHFKAREFWQPVAHPELGQTLTYCGGFVKMSQTPIEIRRRAPGIGEHNDEIYRELGLSGPQPCHCERSEAISPSVAVESISSPVRAWHAMPPDPVLRASSPAAVPPEPVLRASSPAESPPATGWKTVVPQQALAGLKVVDFGVIGVNPMTTRYLADYGATVIRVESHTRPELQRTMRPFKDNIPGIDRSGVYPYDNCSKLGISLDLAKPQGREIGLKLIKWADVVGEGFPPGTMKKLGLDYTAARKVKPDIIYFSTCMLGQYGPYTAFKGFGYQAASLAGFYKLMGWPDRGPAGIFGAYTDWLTPRFGAAAIIAALDYRKRTGKGQYIDQSQVECAMHLIAPVIMDYTVNGREQGATGNHLPCAAPHGVYPCQGEDRWVSIAVFKQEEWEALCRTIGWPELAGSGDFRTLPDRKKNEDALDRIVSGWTVQLTPDEAMSRLQAAGVPAGAVRDVKDVFEDPQLKHRGHFRWLEHPALGVHANGALSFRFSKTPDCQRPAPTLGQDNEYVFKNILGMSDDDIGNLLVDHVITTDADLPQY